MEDYLKKLKTDFKTKNIIVGIDEYGCSAALGPLVYACVFWDFNLRKTIQKTFRFSNAKNLEENSRQNKFKKICEFNNIIGYKAIVIDPQRMSNDMLLRNKICLNKILIRTSIQILRDLFAEEYNIKEIYIITIGKLPSYRKIIEEHFPKTGIKFNLVAKNELSTFPVIAAASIVAKVCRDNMLKNWSFKENINKNLNDSGNFLGNEIGSGYPSDPKTKKWMEKFVDNVFGFPTVARFSWTTIKTLIKNKSKCVKWENYDEEQEFLKFKEKYKEHKINKFFDNIINNSQNNNNDINDDIIFNNIKKELMEEECINNFMKYNFYPMEKDIKIDLNEINVLDNLKTINLDFLDENYIPISIAPYEKEKIKIWDYFEENKTSISNYKLFK